MEKLETQRHTLAHITAAALQTTYGDRVKFGTGPATDNGFYYDVRFEDGTDFNENDLKNLEKQIWKIINQNLEIKQYNKSIGEALELMVDQPFKLELIKDLENAGETEVSFYQIGEFIDLCKGPHLARTGEIPKGSFKLSNIAGAYWRGDEKREMLTRIYGLAFASAEDLKAYLEQQEEAKKRDHRKLGRDLDLFCYSKLVGSGLPLFTPRGTVLRTKLTALTEGVRLKRGYQKVTTSNIGLVELYKVSGHYEKFPELLKFVSEESGDELALKPVSCPHHIEIYASSSRSYKELPIKYLETTMVYRDERKGELGGLSRVRAITQDDSHVFAREDQVGQIFGELVEAAKEIYALLDIKLKLRLSFRDDSDGYIGTKEMWAKAEADILAMAGQFGLEYFVAQGEAAMYGPKMDFMATDALGREWQLATVQLDYALPERFGLEFTDEDGQKKRPVMIHSALLGALERFMSIFIEHTAGHFPFWCAPEQVRVLTINDQVLDYAQQIEDILKGVILDEPIKHDQLRYAIDKRSESLGRKLKDALSMKIPVILIVGEKDKQAGQVSVRLRDHEQKVKLDQLAEFLQKI